MPRPFRRPPVAIAIALAAASLSAALAVAATLAAGASANTDGPALVDFEADGLSPAAVAIVPGASVRWTNRDQVGHNTTHLPPAGEPSLWNSYELVPGAAFTHTFTAAGTYRYFDFFDADNPAYQGVVIVTTGEVPDTPTPRPTRTEGPSPTRPPPTATPMPTATPSPTAVLLQGQLLPYSGGCPAEAAVRLCSTGRSVPISAGFDLSAYQYLDVNVEGVETICPSTGEAVVLVSSIRALPAGCSAPTPTPPPSPTPSTTDNLALGRTVRVSLEVPGYGASLATDGDPATAWYAASETAWAYVDLGTERTLNQVVLRWSDPFAARFGIYAWDAPRGQWSGLYWNDTGRGGDETISLPPTYARYLLLYAVGSSAPQGGFAVGELEVYGRQRPNLALGASLVASGAQECCPPWLAADGDFATGWASRRGNPAPWYRLHLPPATDITEVRLYWDHFAFPTTYSLVFYQAGEARQLIVPAAPPGLNRFEFTWPMRTDVLLVYAHRLSALGFVAMSEAQLYGPRLEELSPGPPPAGGGLLARPGLSLPEVSPGRRSWLRPRRLQPGDGPLPPVRLLETGTTLKWEDPGADQPWAAGAPSPGVTEELLQRRGG